MKIFYRRFFKGFAVLFCLYSSLLSAKRVERVAAVVNNEVITQYDLDRALAFFRKGGESPETRRKVLEELVHQKLLEQEVSKAEIEVTDADLSRTIQGLLQRNQMSIEELRVELSAKGISFDSYKDQLKTEIRQAKFIQQNLASRVHVTSEDVENFRRRYPQEKDRKEDEIWQRIFNERLEQEIQSHVRRLRKKAYVEIRD